MERAQPSCDNLIPHGAEVLVAVGECRKVMRDAQTEVQPFTAAYYAVATVTAALDALAMTMTNDANALDAQRGRAAAKQIGYQDCDDGEAPF